MWHKHPTPQMNLHKMWKKSNAEGSLIDSVRTTEEDPAETEPSPPKAKPTAPAKKFPFKKKSLPPAVEVTPEGDEESVEDADITPQEDDTEEVADKRPAPPSKAPAKKFPTKKFPFKKTPAAPVSAPAEEEEAIVEEEEAIVEEEEAIVEEEEAIVEDEEAVVEEEEAPAPPSKVPGLKRPAKGTTGFAKKSSPSRSYLGSKSQVVDYFWDRIGQPSVGRYGLYPSTFVEKKACQAF